MLKEIIEELEEKYSIVIPDFMELYKRKLSKEALGSELALSQHSIDDIFNKLNLKKSKDRRAECYVQHVVALSVEDEASGDLADASSKENEYLRKKLNVAQRALQRSRDESNHLRAIQRKSIRGDSFEEKVLDLIEGALPIKQKSKINVTVNPACPSFTSHVSGLMLSDLHCEEAVTTKDVGNSNEYNWEIFEQRIDTLFQAWFDEYRGESRGIIFILGDVISGVIHDILESTTKPTAEAVSDLADLLNDYITAASVIFNDVEIYFVSGNHERISQNIKSASKGFDFGYLFAKILNAKLGAIDNVTMEISTNGYAAVEIGKRWIGMHHGDIHRGVKSDLRTANIQEAFKNVLGVEVWHVLEGHSHKFSHHNTNRGDSICNGSVIGSNAYGHTNGFVALRPSQTIVTFEPDGEIDFVKQVFLD